MSKKMVGSRIQAMTFSLPEDISLDIILRLPVKSLLRLKCLSKTWCSLISSKKFAKTQLEYSTKNTPLFHHNAIIISEFDDDAIIASEFDCGCSLNHCLVGSLFSDSPVNAVQCGFDHTMIGNRISIVGCLNGLFCMFVDGYGFILWNPSTRKYNMLPAILDEHPWLITKGYGFGESDGDYKVLAILAEYGYATSRVFRLYSLKNNSCKTVEDFWGDGLFHRQGVFVNGKLHWGKASNRVFDNITWFDLSSEAAGSIEQPSGPVGSLYLELSVLEGCLCVLCDNPEIGMEFWVMKEYGVKDSWCRRVTIPKIAIPGGYGFSVFYPVCISDKDEFLVQQGSSLIVYNPTMM